MVALALLAGGGIWLGVAGGDDGSAADGKQEGPRYDAPGTEKPASRKADLLFHVPDPKVGKGAFHSVPGSWVTAETYVKSGLGTIAGYDLKSGRQVWEIALGGEVCGYTQYLDDGRTGVLHRDGMPGTDGKATPCTEIAALDLNAGLLLWKASVERSGAKIPFRQIGLGAGKVAVAGDEGGAAFALDSGKLLWEPRPTEPCYDMAYGSGEDLVALQNCGQEDNSHARVQLLHGSGKPRSTYDLPKNLDFAQIVSSEPLVIAGIMGGRVTDYFSIDGRKGTLRSKISVDPERTLNACSVLVYVRCDGIAVGNDRLYVTTKSRTVKNDSESANEIVAYDLETGKATGQKADSGGKATLQILRMDGRDLLAYRLPMAGSPGQVIKIDPRTFKETVYLSVPPSSEGASVQRYFTKDTTEYRYVKGRLFVSELHVRPPDPYTDDPPYLAAAFGAAPDGG
ncbi:PQQ-binding-like beta-propeller repeat protein [Streptomyces sp. TRM66268-LWL]|uniref:PQQ-binding-like beta-propeller repeat protein n=1 Tax=Streptomyces polyasparticus TaxID=2767826 RepID=A0ABR7SD04_9ACTN|nr:PQQ-binding-like beta-propeller repeat protein [Streptomyces polyasparticus]MBC9712832.1 PQQ-binding-like beta-propeller repeat protein [Streptomyces polyasparticus]